MNPVPSIVVSSESRYILILPNKSVDDFCKIWTYDSPKGALRSIPVLLRHLLRGVWEMGCMYHFQDILICLEKMLKQLLFEIN